MGGLDLELGFNQVSTRRGERGQVVGGGWWAERVNEGSEDAPRGKRDTGT